MAKLDHRDEAIVMRFADEVERVVTPNDAQGMLVVSHILCKY